MSTFVYLQYERFLKCSCMSEVVPKRQFLADGDEFHYIQGFRGLSFGPNTTNTGLGESWHVQMGLGCLVNAEPEFHQPHSSSTEHLPSCVTLSAFAGAEPRCHAKELHELTYLSRRHELLKSARHVQSSVQAYSSAGFLLLPVSRDFSEQSVATSHI